MGVFGIGSWRWAWMGFRSTSGKPEVRLKVVQVLRSDRETVSEVCWAGLLGVVGIEFGLRFVGIVKNRSERLQSFDWRIPSSGMSCKDDQTDV